MAQFLDVLIPENPENNRYDQYLREARAKIDPSKISDDEDGLIYWFFWCLYTDCRNHGIGDGFRNYEEELRLAAESQAICEILNARKKALTV
jgi:hypothetical protein